MRRPGLLHVLAAKSAQASSVAAGNQPIVKAGTGVSGGARRTGIRSGHLGPAALDCPLEPVAR